MATLSISALRKSFGAVDAVQAVDLDVADGEFLVLVGPSGCGKSTILRMIAGLEHPTSGEIRVDDRRLNDVAPRDRDMAMVFQDYALYPHMSVADNLGFALKMHGVAPDEIARRVHDAARMLQLESLLERKPRALSGGQRQRVALGRALVRKPKLFLFDEPLSNLDAKLRVGMRVEIRKLQLALKTTSIYVTHDQVEAMTMADRIVILNAGVIQQVGPPTELYTKPANAFVATFIGSPPMSLIPGELVQDSSGFGVKLGEGVVVPLQRRRLLDAATHEQGRKVTLGARAEHVGIERPSASASASAFAFSSDVSLVEDHGADSMAMIGLSGSPLIARVAPGAVRTGETARPFFMDVARIHVFDAQTGAALLV